MRLLNLKQKNGSILVGLLWCLALLSLVVIGVLHTSRLDLLVGRHHADRIQAHYLALAGIEKAKALLYHDARERTRSAQHHTGRLYDDPEQFRDVRLGRGRFSVFRAAREGEGGGIIYGIGDEESRLNVNTASQEELGRLHLMRPEVAAAIIDWRDEDHAVTQGGVEAEYYAAMQPPRQPRNGSLQTLRELGMIRGVTPGLLRGDDTQLTGISPAADEFPEEGGGGDSVLITDRGWAAHLTVHSGINNVSASGSERIDVQSADEAALTGVRGITTDIARAIIAYRGQNRLETVAHLLDVTAPAPGGPAPGVVPPGAQLPEGVQVPGAPGQGPVGNAGPNPGGPRVIDSELLMDIHDELTAGSDSRLEGVINLNTAGVDVLACLPGVDRQLAQAIVSHRQSSGFFPNPASLLQVPGVTADLFKQIAARVSARSETFRILSEGRIDSTGVRKRIEVVVHVGLSSVETLACREDDL
jgi:DNA uptake protein ComE-like DNA-binding protein